MTLWTDTAPRRPIRWTLRMLARLDAAYARRQRYLDVPASATRDTGLSPEALSGEPSWQPDLPFFLQPGYGDKHGR